MVMTYVIQKNFLLPTLEMNYKLAFLCKLEDCKVYPLTPAQIFVVITYSHTGHWVDACMRRLYVLCLYLICSNKYVIKTQQFGHLLFWDKVLKNCKLKHWGESVCKGPV